MRRLYMNEEPKEDLMEPFIDKWPSWLSVVMVVLGLVLLSYGLYRKNTEEDLKREAETVIQGAVPEYTEGVFCDVFVTEENKVYDLHWSIERSVDQETFCKIRLRLEKNKVEFPNTMEAVFYIQDSIEKELGERIPIKVMFIEKGIIKNL